MTTQEEPRREHPSTYFVQDRHNEEELNRLRVQDRLVTESMGGVLPEQPADIELHRVLDIGCGSGSWAIDVALAYPDVSVSGIDISIRMVEYAREQAREQGVADRVEFHVMDALRMLEFPAGYFDLTNMRLEASFLRTWDWPKLLSEMQRVTRLDGVVRVTENEIIHQSNSPAFTQWFEMFQCALAHAGNIFEQDTTGITAHLAPLFSQHGVQHIQTKAYVLEYQAETPRGQAYCEDAKHIFRTGRPFITKWGCLSADYDAICQQALKEMQQSNFYSQWKFLTAWGSSPTKKGQKPPQTDHR